jgi:predicted TIM-barrel fold metal-dependent hydrolase
VPVERTPASVRSPADLQRELTEERAGRQRAEQALATGQAMVSTLQAALSRSEQAARAARETVEEREAAMVGLHAELQQASSLSDLTRREVGR